MSDGPGAGLSLGAGTAPSWMGARVGLPLTTAGSRSESSESRSARCHQQFAASCGHRNGVW